jgi:hypothetical protein
VTRGHRGYARLGMGLTDVTGVLSRYFVVGFFMPWFFALAALWQAASDALLPNDFEQHGAGVELAIVAVLALLAALAASGLEYPLTRLLEGYPLEATRRRRLLGAVYARLLGGEQRRYDALLVCREDESRSSEDRTNAAWRLDRFFPDGRSRLLPTRLGNAIRAFEDYPYKRWCLDGVALWPRVELMLTADEREPYTDAKIDVSVFLNAAVAATLVGAALVVDAILNAPLDWYWGWLYLAPFLVAYLAYRSSVGAAARWGSEVRACFDLHRRDLYPKYGLRLPRSPDEERVLARQLNRLVMYGDSIDPRLWDGAPAEAPAAAMPPTASQNNVPVGPSPTPAVNDPQQKPEGQRESPS